MLREIIHVRQIPGEPMRRWFMSHAMDLIVWHGTDDLPVGFQFCYDKNRTECALTWRSASGFTHMRVYDGEAGGGLGKSTPLLAGNARFDRERANKLFAANCHFVPPTIAELVFAKIAEYSPDP